MNTQLATWQVEELTLTTTIHQYVLECLGPWKSEYDTNAIEQDLEHSINHLMPKGYTLVDNKIYGPEGTTPPDLEAIIEQINFQAIADTRCIIPLPKYDYPIKE